MQARGREAKVGDGVPVSIYVNYPGERKSHDRPGASSAKVGKLASSRAKRCWPLGIKAVINYAITWCYLKIKTVFFASIRGLPTATLLYRAISLVPFSPLLPIRLSFCLCLFLILLFSLLYLSRPILHSCQFSNGESFGFYCKGSRAFFSPTHPASFSSVFSLSRGTPAGPFLTRFLRHP